MLRPTPFQASVKSSNTMRVSRNLGPVLGVPTIRIIIKIKGLAFIGPDDLVAWCLRAGGRGKGVIPLV